MLIPPCPSTFPSRYGPRTVPDSSPFTQVTVAITVPPDGEPRRKDLSEVGHFAQRREVADQPPATVDGPVCVLLGDFNATLDHAPLRRLLGTGYRDAADVRGAGFTPTWPYDGKPVPGVTLDHVLADRRVGVRD